MNAEEYTDLKKRIQSIGHRRVEIKKEIDMLKAQRDEILEEVKSLGIEDVSDLSTKIAEWEKDLKEMESALVSRVTEIEQQLEN